MAVCPKCHKIIKELEQVRTGVEQSTFYIEDGLATYDNETFDSDGNFLEYRCYECEETLFCDWDEAEDFLKNKDKVAEMVAKKVNEKDIK